MSFHTVRTFVRRYAPEAHKSSQLSSRSETTKSKFLTDGLEDVEGEGDRDEGEDEERCEGLNLKFSERFFKLIRLNIGKVSSQFFSHLVPSACGHLPLRRLAD